MKLGPIEELMARLSMGIQSHHLTKLRFSCADLNESQKQTVQSPIQLLVVLRKKSNSNDQFLAKLERIFEGVDDFEEFAKMVEEFHSLHPNPDSIPPSPRPAFSNSSLSFQPSRDQKVKFKKMLVRVSDSMNWIHVEVMLALSPVPDNLKEYVKAGFQLFEELQRHGCISENDTELLDQFFSILNLKTPATLLHTYQRHFPPQVFDDPPPSAPIYRSLSQPSSSLGSTPPLSGSYTSPYGSLYSHLPSHLPSAGSHPSLSSSSLPSRYGSHSTLSYQSGLLMSSPSPSQATSHVPPSSITPPGQPSSRFPDPSFTPPTAWPIQDSSPPPTDPVTYPSIGSQVGRKRPVSETHSGDPLERPPPPKSIHSASTYGGNRERTGELHSVPRGHLAPTATASIPIQAGYVSESFISVGPSRTQYLSTRLPVAHGNSSLNTNTSSFAPDSQRFCMRPITQVNTGNQCLEHGMEPILPSSQPGVQSTAGGPVQETSPVQPPSHPAGPSKMVASNWSSLYPPLPQGSQVHNKEAYFRRDDKLLPSLNVAVTEHKASIIPRQPTYSSRQPTYSYRQPTYSYRQPTYSYRQPTYSSNPPHKTNLTPVAEETGRPAPGMAGRWPPTHLVQPTHHGSLSSYGASSLESQGLSSYSAQTLDTRNLLSGLSSMGGSMEPGTPASSQQREHHERKREEGGRGTDQFSEGTEPQGGEVKPGLDTSEYPGAAEEEGEKEEERSSSSLVGRIVSGVTGFLGSLTSLGRGSGHREEEKTGGDEEHLDEDDEYESCPED